MPHFLKRLDARAERGFSMFLVIMTLTLCAMFVAAAFTAANGDLPISGVAQERKSAYSAAEAGLAFYLNRLQLDPDYWTKCDTGDAPNASEKNPVNQLWNGVGKDPRNWRNIPGSTDQYTIELMPTKDAPIKNGVRVCDPTKQASFVDMARGTFKLKVSGRARDGAQRQRSIIATFRRDSFLNFVYFSDYENRDPAAESNSTDRNYQNRYCADKYRSARKGRDCPEIQFGDRDEINGPLHTNDENLLICGSPTFGRITNRDGTPRQRTDTVEVNGGAPGYTNNGSACANNPVIQTVNRAFDTGVKRLPMPDSNKDLETVAANGGSLYSGRTFIRLLGNSIQIVNNGVTTTRGWPTNGVLYVKNAGSGSCSGEIPTDADYVYDVNCGDAYVSGSYSQPLTIAAANDIIIKPTGGASNANITQSATNDDATLGLIANNNVRVAHLFSSDCKTNRLESGLRNVTIEAAILSLQHSFIVDNYDCGLSGTLTVIGAIVQKYRGPVGTSTGSTMKSGYVKDYWYDDRFRYRNPPYFLTPIDAAWDIVRQHEFIKG